MVMMTRRRILLAAAASAACRSAFAATDPAQATPGLRNIAAKSGLLYGSYIDPWELKEEADYEAVCARECGLMVDGRMDWDHLQPTPDRHDFTGVDADYDWATANGMKFRGHTLVYGERAPSWYAALPDRKTAVDALETHVAETCRHFAGRVQSWDVVNEAILMASPRPDKLRPHVFLDRIGPDYLDIAYRTARANDPKALLVYNEFDIEMEKPDQLEKRRVMFELIDGFKKRGVPLDAIGLQSHLFYEDMQHFDEKAFSRFLDDIASRGLQIMLTELDCVDNGAPTDIAARDAAVASVYRRYLDVALANRAVSAVITWGVSDRMSWIISVGDPRTKRPDGLRPRPLPFDADDRPKPVYWAMVEALRNAPHRAASVLHAEAPGKR
ncbi:MAG TPA: endo-1,4-beta-xylanase [Stellaceae bacterium]|nr:endo-1,4-beta-xylanase [Stellaceae bacterium]